MAKFCEIRKNKKWVLCLTLLAVILGVCLVCFIGFNLRRTQEADSGTNQFHSLGADFTDILVEDEASAIAAAQAAISTKH